MTIELSELLEAVSDERIKRWIWNQLPERTRYEGDIENYVVDSLRVRYDPIEAG